MIGMRGRPAAPHAPFNLTGIVYYGTDPDNLSRQTAKSPRAASKVNDFPIPQV
jgi:hypothetical protein